MPYKPIKINRKNLISMDVNFDSVDNFEADANALGTVMVEGFDLAPKSIEIIRDYLSSKKNPQAISTASQRKAHVQQLRIHRPRLY